MRSDNLIPVQLQLLILTRGNVRFILWGMKRENQNRSIPVVLSIQVESPRFPCSFGCPGLCITKGVYSIHIKPTTKPARRAGIGRVIKLCAGTSLEESLHGTKVQISGFAETCLCKNAKALLNTSA